MLTIYLCEDTPAGPKSMRSIMWPTCFRQGEMVHIDGLNYRVRLVLHSVDADRIAVTLEPLRKAY